jgi:hypothetical protein
MYSYKKLDLGYRSSLPYSISLNIRDEGPSIATMSKGRKGNKLLVEVQNQPNQYSCTSSTKAEKKNSNLDIEQEIECPRCHDIMTLSSQFDRLCYLCEECDFRLNLN